jgi:hypothetical protein
MKTDFQILEELFDTIEQLKQRLGGDPNRGYLSSSRKLRKDVADFTGKCRNGELKGRARNRKSGELFNRIISLHPDVWPK